MKYSWVFWLAFLITTLIFGIPILLSQYGLLEISESLELLAFFNSWPIVIVIIGLFFMSRFRSAIDYFLKNIGSLKFPGGIEIQKQDQPSLISDKHELDDSLVPHDPDALEKFDNVLAEIGRDEQLTSSEIQQLKQQYLQASDSAKIWKFAYLNLFYIPQTKNVLSWFARSAPQARQSFDTLWMPYIPDQNQRNTILSVLLLNGMLVEEGTLIRISEDGYSFLQFIGNIPYAPPQQDA